MLTVKKCVRCNKDNGFNDDNYCMFCGALLENKCQNDECTYYHNETILPKEAAFCPECGYETLFKSYGLASSVLPPEFDLDLPF